MVIAHLFFLVMLIIEFRMAQWLGRFLGITGWDPSVCKFNMLHVDILRVSFIKFGYILWIFLKWLVIFLRSWTLTDYFSNSTCSFVINCRFSPIIGMDISPIYFERMFFWYLLHVEPHIITYHSKYKCPIKISNRIMHVYLK